MKDLEKKLGLLNQKEITKMSNFKIAEEPIVDPTGVNWKTGAKVALAAGGMLAVWLPCATAAAASI